MKIFHVIKNKIYLGNKTKIRNNLLKNFLEININTFNIINIKKISIKLFLYKKYLKNFFYEKKIFLFISTKNFLREIIYKYARSLKQYFVCNKWIAGTLTNSINYKKLLNKSIYLKKKQKMNFTKKEKNIFFKEEFKIETIYGGLRGMHKLPDLIIITDIKKDKVAVNEAKKLKIKILALLDTDDSPKGIDFFIPCNNSSIVCVKNILKILFSEIC
ncbi:30S ribosomal protein S2 [Candidatus Carsonella ruddii]|uniref:Small ribosomal subunit protein uS2 n=1 Tax=Carsonella ruddii TaxID=114186 RepID=A0A1U9RRN4_CARRU|nr:30S ribosomal protein S2 [Candidatus Carsonella ruddii]AQU89439.1 SSU ribosomal protein S2p (SAe) [Candidatus Carsonella ruddii]